MHQENKGDLSFYLITATDNYPEGSCMKETKTEVQVFAMAVD
jgi:hypothetical protein